MKRKLSALLALILAFGTTLGMTACGGKKPAPNTANDLEIFYWNSGQGREWLDKTIEAFKAENPGVNVVKNFSEINQSWQNELRNPATNTIDLYINSMPTLLANTKYLEPLDTVMEFEDENDIKIIDKFDDTLMDDLRGADGKLYGAYWGGGACGLLYNKSIFEKEGFTIPRTTDELALLAKQIVERKDDNGKSKGYIPFIFPGKTMQGPIDYWTYCYMPWAAQYGGIEEITAYWNPEVKGNTVSNEKFKSQARLEALKALEKITEVDGYYYKASNTMSHTAVQTEFLYGTGLMMPNGNWVENEMKKANNNGTKFEFMKLPIISSLGPTIGINDDRILREVVAYVDSEDYANSKDSGTLVFNADSNEYDAMRIENLPKATIDRVAQARSIVYTEGTSNKMAIPKGANAKGWAEKFIQFMNTERGLKFYWETLQAPMLAKISTPIDTSNWSEFAKNTLSLAKDASFVFRSKGNPFFYNNGLEFYPENPQITMMPANFATRKTAQQFWDEKCLPCYDETQTTWKNWVKYSGLVD